MTLMHIGGRNRKPIVGLTDIDMATTDIGMTAMAIIIIGIGITTILI